MKLRAGIKALISLSILGIGIAAFLIYTCPFAGQIAFSTLVRQVPMEHDSGVGGHSQKGGADVQKPHAGMQEHKEGRGEVHEKATGHPEPIQKPREAATEHHEEKGLSVHFMMYPNVRQYPVKEKELLGIEVSPLGIIVLLLLIALCLLILQQRPLNFFGWTLTSKAMGVTVLLITLWNLFFSAFLLGVEIVYLKELWLTWLAFDATVVASVIVVVLSFSRKVFSLRLKGFESLDEWILEEEKNEKRCSRNSFCAASGVF